jgi:putative Mg2+ transporter-C (MgtC) family protein
MELFLTTGDITIYNGVFRLFLAVVAGGLIGMNREKLNRAAGFRTHVLIAMGSCLIMLISIFIPQEFLDFKNGDPGRIASQVVTGIGFLGAGAIIKLGDHVKGLTTAASIWVSAAIGLAVGAGMFWIALAAVFFVLVTLIILERMERMMFRKRIFKTLSLQLKQSDSEIKAVESIITRYNAKYSVQEFRRNTSLGILNVEINLTVDNHFKMDEFINEVAAIPNLQEVSVKSKS